MTEQLAFDPYGRPNVAGSAKSPGADEPSTLGFQGAITDPTTSSVVLGPRLYDPTTARFSTPDTFVYGGVDLTLGTDPLTGNRYLFAASNPVGYFDDGHKPKKKDLPDLTESCLAGNYEQLITEECTHYREALATENSDYYYQHYKFEPQSSPPSTWVQFADFTSGADSEKAALDPGYTNVFSETESWTAERIRTYGPACAAGARDALVPAVATSTTPIGFAGKTVAGCGEGALIEWTDNNVGGPLGDVLRLGAHALEVVQAILAARDPVTPLGDAVRNIRRTL